MAVYVDQLRTYPDEAIKPAARKYGNRWCHLWTDPGNEDELHAMADRIGIMRKYCQRDNPDFTHYDLIPSKRARALEHGAVERDLKDWLVEQKRLKEKAEQVLPFGLAEETEEPQGDSYLPF